MKKYKWMMALFLLFCGIFPNLAFSQQWKIGILAQRGSAYAHTRWQPWIDWLNDHFSPHHQFSLVTLDLDDLEKNQAQGVDFLLTNQAQFFYLNNTNVRWLVTLANQYPDQTTSANHIGSAIFVRKDSDFYTLSDLKNSVVGAVSPKAFGGFLLGYNEFYKRGLSEKEVKLIFTGFPVENPLLLLQEKKVDAAIVPTCILEELIQEKALKADNFRLLLAKKNHIGCMASTELLPNWSLAALPQVPTELASEFVTLLLGNIPPNLPHWTPPYSTNQADTLLRKLYKHPKQNIWQVSKFWLEKYKGWIIAIGVLLILNYLWISLQIHRKSKALRTAYQEMRNYEQKLTQADRLSLLGEMSTGIAHEINQPLSAVRMYAEGIKYQLKNSPNKNQPIDILDKILIQVDRSTEIVRNLINWAKGKDDGQAEEISLKILLQRSIQFIELSQPPTYEIRLICPESIQLHIRTTLLEQIICNCLINAIQANATQIHINVTQQSTLKIYITDNGTGFSDEELAFSFVPFRTTKPRGLGLGLVLCQRLIRSLNGEIYLRNRTDQQGAEIILTLPYSHHNKI